MILSYLMLLVCYKCIVLFTMSISGSTLKMLEKLKKKNSYSAARNLDHRSSECAYGAFPLVQLGSSMRRSEQHIIGQSVFCGEFRTSCLPEGVIFMRFQHMFRPQSGSISCGFSNIIYTNIRGSCNASGQLANCVNA